MRLNYIPIQILILSIIFNGLYTVKFGVNLKSFYVFLFFSLILILYLKKNLEIKLHHIVIPLYLMIVGSINSYYDNTNFLRVFFQSSAVCACLIVFYNSYSLFFYKKKYAQEMFSRNYSFIITFYVLVSLIIFLFKKSITTDPQIRLFGLLAEPSILSLIIMPALLYSIDQIKKNLNLLHFALSVIYIFAIFQTKSTLGYFGLIIIPIFLIYKMSIKIYFILFLLTLLIFVINVTPFLSGKISQLVEIYSTGNLYSFHGPTSVTFYINAVIAFKSFFSSPFFGNGLGSHAISYFENVFNIPGTQSYPTSLYIGLNYNDANSLFFRILSETGIVGIIFLIYYVIKYYSPNIYSNMTLILLTLMLVRQGNFVNPEFFLFIYFYYFNYHNQKNEKN